MGVVRDRGFDEVLRPRCCCSLVQAVVLGAPVQSAARHPQRDAPSHWVRIETEVLEGNREDVEDTGLVVHDQDPAAPSRRDDAVGKARIDAGDRDYRLLG